MIRCRHKYGAKDHRRCQAHGGGGVETTMVWRRLMLTNVRCVADGPDGCIAIARIGLRAMHPDGAAS
jgi:hypothetical protein